jgi:protein TonB
LTAEAGTGPNNYGLARGDGSGNMIGGGGGLDPQARAAIQAYGRIAAADVQAALRRDEKLRFAKFIGEMRIWLDSAGKITRVQLATSSGDPSMDSAVARVLTGLTLREPPPADIPQAVRELPLRVRARTEPG